MATAGAAFVWLIMLTFLAIVALMLIASLAWLIRATRWIFVCTAIGVREALELCSGR